MTIFGPGLMRERTTRRAVAGSVVQVLEPGTDLPVETVIAAARSLLAQTEPSRPQP